MSRTGRLLPWPSAEERREVARVLDRLGIGDLAKRHIRQLSGGQQQRMFVARALLRRPKLLLLDEPTAGVDPAARRRFWATIRTLAAEGTTVLVTTHYMDEAEYCDRASIMVAGRIAALGTPDEIKGALDADTMDEAFVRLARAGGAGEGA